MTLLTAGDSGALFAISGEVATNATWSEDIYFTEAGAAYTLTGLAWKMTFRDDPEDTGADFTLSTDDGTLVITADSDGYYRILRIAVAAGTLSAYEGDYICDLASQDASSTVTLWAHGIVSFRLNPVTF